MNIRNTETTVLKDWEVNSFHGQKREKVEGREKAGKEVLDTLVMREKDFLHFVLPDEGTEQTEEAYYMHVDIKIMIR